MSRDESAAAHTRLPSGRDPHQPMNPWIEQEQRSIERFVKAEYWRLARLGDGRFAFTRAPLRAES
jgi:hypothetical protein